MSNHEDLSQSPIQYPGSNEVQWIHNPDTNHVVLQDDSLQQWNEFTQPEMVTSVTSSTGSHPVFTHTNGISSISGFESFMNTSNGSINGLVLPNGARIGNGNLLPNRGNVPLAFRPRPPNGNASVNHWASPDQNAGRLIRPNWNGVKTGGVRKPKRIRTAFTSSQMMELEQEYTRTRYLDRTRRIELAEYLHLNERTIKIWFQNRRMKEKKDKAESFEEEEATSTTDSASDLGMPVAVSDMPIDGVYHRGGVYLHDQYPVSSMSSQMPSPMQAGPSSMMNGYQAFAQEHYDSSHRDVQTIPHHHTPYTGEVLETLDESRSQTEALNAPGNVLEQSWDVSWIKSIHITDDC